MKLVPLSWWPSPIMSGQSVIRPKPEFRSFFAGIPRITKPNFAVTLAEVVEKFAQQIRRAQTSSTKKQKDGKYKKHLHIAMFLSSMP